MPTVTSSDRPSLPRRQSRLARPPDRPDPRRAADVILCHDVTQGAAGGAGLALRHTGRGTQDTQPRRPDHARCQTGGSACERAFVNIACVFACQ